jgi:hypothetical protein
LWSGRLLASSQHNLYDIYLLLCIQYQTSDDGQKTSPKHVEFYSKNKFEKLVHIVVFIIRIYHDAQSSECQRACMFVLCNMSSFLLDFINRECTGKLMK